MQGRHDGAHKGFFEVFTCACEGQGLGIASFRTQRVAKNISHQQGERCRGGFPCLVPLFDIVGLEKREDARLALSFWFWVIYGLRKLKL